MTLDRAQELLTLQISLASGYNRNAARLILLEVKKDHGPQAVDQLIRQLDLETHFGFKEGSI
ncbi:MAG: hypothetical protein GXP22_06255 [Gammaproteobacteria bacterium]|nr:hypothetical protein [Gammaproteobacteria bacterium]